LLKVTIFLYVLNLSFLYLYSLFHVQWLLSKRQKEEKGKKRSKDEIRQNKEIPTFLMREW